LKSGSRQESSIIIEMGGMLGVGVKAWYGIVTKQKFWWGGRREINST
jgi:hypothetical protein